MFYQEPTSISFDGPYFGNCRRNFVGCYNGLVCMVFEETCSCYPHQVVVIWNPAMKLFKSVEHGIPLMWPQIVFMSLGFGYDAKGDDFKLVRIFAFDNAIEDVRLVQVYSLNSDSWISVRVDFEIENVTSCKNEVIVNGNPYWVAEVDGKEVLVCCDVTNLVCKIVPLPSFFVRGKVKLVEWDGAALGAFVCDESCDKSLEVWVFDEEEQIWRRNSTFGASEMMIADRYLQCLKNVMFLGLCSDVVDASQKRTFEIYGYAETLSRVKGMTKGVEVEVEVDEWSGNCPRRTLARVEDFLKSCFQFES